MEPGRELDALVAEKVMGYRIFNPPPIDDPWEVLPDNSRGRPVLAYSTDIAAAWEVLEKMRLLLPGQEIMLYYCDGWSVGALCQAAGTIEIGDRFTDVESVATAPHAICLAAEALAGKPVVP